jgi:hypothetical protein
MIAVRQFSSKQTSISFSTQFLKRGLISGAKTASGTATDEGVDTLSIGGGGEGPPATGGIYYFRDDDRPTDNLQFQIGHSMGT